MQKILVLEDDRALAMGIEYALQAEGYEVLCAFDLQEARNMLGKEENKPLSLLLLDVCLPDGTGYELCDEVRKSGNQVPIIFLTAMSEEVSIVRGLETGADDYVAKPFRLKELLSRIRANIRRYEMTHSEVLADDKLVIAFGNYRFLPDEYRLFAGEEQVECTLSELRLLKELVNHAEMVLSREQLLQRLFDTEEAFVEDNTLSVYMKRLRSRLGEEAGRIETVRGVGYRFHL
ncbi:MAG: response regulator transcription factor [Acetatifactor sp.]|nr:response regulator transcription factor [Acetatifactor sp.]